MTAHAMDAQPDSSGPVARRLDRSRRTDADNLKTIDSDKVNQMVEWLKLLADDSRLRIVLLLHQADELNVRELCKLLKQRQPSVSHHLALLRVAGLIDMRRDGKHNFYRLVPEKLEHALTAFLGGEPGRTARVVFDRFELRYQAIDSGIASP